jgi:hypothetical protein
MSIVASPKDINADAEASRRRRAVFGALQAYLSEPALASALWSWEKNFSGNGSFQLSDYVHAVCTNFGLSPMEREIHRRLVRQMGMSAEQLGPDPRSLMQSYLDVVAIDSEPAAASGDPATRVFNEILACLFDRMDEISPIHANHVRELLVDRLAHGTLPANALAELSGWLAAGEPMTDLGLTVETMRGIIFMVYVDTREHFGPESAERLMGEAEEAADRLPEARVFAPRQLF